MALSLRGIFQEMTAWPGGATYVTPLTSTVYLGHESQDAAVLRPISAAAYYDPADDPRSEDPSWRAFAAMDPAQQMKVLKAMSYEDLLALDQVDMAAMGMPLKEEVIRVCYANINYIRNKDNPTAAERAEMKTMHDLRRSMVETMGFDPAFAEEFAQKRARLAEALRDDPVMQGALDDWGSDKESVTQYAARVMDHFCAVFDHKKPAGIRVLKACPDAESADQYKGHVEKFGGKIEDVVIRADWDDPQAVTHAALETAFGMYASLMSIYPDYGLNAPTDAERRQADVFTADHFVDYDRDAPPDMAGFDRYLNRPLNRFIMNAAIDTTRDVAGGGVDAMQRQYNAFYVQQRFEGGLYAVIDKATSEGKLRPLLAELWQELPPAFIMRSLSASAEAQMMMEAFQDRCADDTPLGDLRRERLNQYVYKRAAENEAASISFASDPDELNSKYKRRILQAQKDLPPGIANLFREFGVSTNIALRMISIDNSVEDNVARGYEGRSSSFSPAHFNSASWAMNFSQQREVEKNGQRGEPGARHYADHGRDPYGSYWHEAGHAVDEIMGLFSDNDPAFADAMEAGLARIRADMAINGAKKYGHIHYFMTKDMGGKQETTAAVRSEIFAELYCEQNGGRKPARLGPLFPEAAAIVKERAAQLEDECRAFPGFRNGSEAMRQEILMNMISAMFADPDDGLPGAAAGVSSPGQKAPFSHRG